MRCGVELLKADITEELRQLSRLEDEFSQVEGKLSARTCQTMTEGRSVTSFTISTTAARPSFGPSPFSSRTTWAPKPGTETSLSA